MRKLLLILIIFSVTKPFCQTKHELDSITHVLEKISIADQQYRLQWDSIMNKNGMNSPEFIDLIKKMNLQDSINLLTVGKILDQYGWLSKEQTSVDASEALFLVIQHAPLPAQLKYLPVLKKAVANKKAKATDYALLVDRTNMYQGLFQIYGSQLNYDAKGVLHIFPIMDEPNVDKRRASVGLPSMQTYLDLFNQNLHYTLPKIDPYKNKLVVKGSISNQKDNQPIPNVDIYTLSNQLLGRTDANGFFQVLIPQKNSNQPLRFKKQGFVTLNYSLENTPKQVYELNLTLQVE